MPGTLYIVATPIGNLADVTYRALQVLKEVDVVLAEDTRITSRLLSRYSIDTPALSYHQHSGDDKKLQILAKLVEGKNIALVTDAGTPGISDPGNELIDWLIEREPGIRILPIPGPSAMSAALSVCGFDVTRFVFLGFLPKKKRDRIFEWLKMGKTAFVFYESPKRLFKTIDLLIEQLGPARRVFVGRELTKMHEQTYRGILRDVKAAIKDEDARGEVVVVVEKP